jgi:hypothetical protein
MPYVVLKAFEADKQPSLKPGDVVDTHRANTWRNREKLIDQRYIRYIPETDKRRRGQQHGTQA